MSGALREKHDFIPGLTDALALLPSPVVLTL